MSHISKGLSCAVFDYDYTNDLPTIVRHRRNDMGIKRRETQNFLSLGIVDIKQAGEDNLWWARGSVRTLEIINKCAV